MSNSVLISQVRDIQSGIHTDEIGNIQFTSGTTGMPKAASLSHYNLVNNAISIGQHMNSIIDNWNEKSVVANVLPLYHVFGFVAGSLSGTLLGASQVYPAPGFNAEAAVKAIEKQQATHLIGTPTMFNDIVNCPIKSDHDISSLSYAIVGGAPVTPALVKQAEVELDCTISVGYGMTENTCGTFLSPLGSEPEIVCETVGLPIPGVEGIVIDPETEEILPEGEIGELCTRGFVLFQGYVGDEEKTKNSYTQDGKWWKTGDLAIIQDGYTK